tara:strand:+ start:91 stop:996 length:906 start_codon:yes stop_codon:yes gene_type:complete
MKKILKILIAPAILAIALTPASASAMCKLSIQTLGETRVEDYNALSRSPNLEPIRLKITNDGREDCIGSIVFQRVDGDGRLTGPRNASLDYWIVDAQGLNKVLFDPTTSRQNALPIRVRANKSEIISPRLFIQRGQAGISGSYHATIEALFRERNNPTGDIRTTVRLAARVTPGVQANFTGVSRSAEGRNAASLVRLGEIEPGMQRSLGLQVRANTDVDVEVSSQNKGRLVRRSGRDGGSIGYKLDIGGSTVDLGGVSAHVLPASVRLQGQTSRIGIQVDNFENAPAGEYRDTILFRISAR